VYWATATHTNCKHNVLLLVSPPGINVYWANTTHTNCKHHAALLVSPPGIIVYWANATHANCKHHAALLVSPPGIIVYWTNATHANCKHHAALLVSPPGIIVYWATATHANCKHHAALLVSQPGINVYWANATHTNCERHAALLVSPPGINVYGVLKTRPRLMFFSKLNSCSQREALSDTDDTNTTCFLITDRLTSFHDTDWYNFCNRSIRAAQKITGDRMLRTPGLEWFKDKIHAAHTTMMIPRFVSRPYILTPAVTYRSDSEVKRWCSSSSRPEWVWRLSSTI
jgi:hypothetical protein